jgi:hypothetical protein
MLENKVLGGEICKDPLKGSLLRHWPCRPISKQDGSPRLRHWSAEKTERVQSPKRKALMATLHSRPEGMVRLSSPIDMYLGWA